MVDYDKSTGTNGTMRMRVLSTTIEFWLKSGYPTAWFGNANFTYTSPHGNGGFSHGYDQGDTWQKMGTITATATGTYSWTMPYSGSNSLGGPTTQSVYVSRATVPPAPTPVAFSEITHESVKTVFNSNGTGGAAIIEWQLSFGTNGGDIDGSGNAMYSSSGTRVMTGLKPGQYYAAWARGRNSVGWGPWSAGRSFYTLSGCHVRVGGVWKSAVPYVKVGGIWTPAIPYIKVGSNPGSWKATVS